MFTIKPHTTRKAQRAQTNLVHTRTQRPHRDRDRTVFEHLLRRYGSAVDCCRSWGSGCSRPGYGKSPLRGGPITPPQSCQNLHRTGKQTLGGKKQNLVCTRTQKKGAMTSQKTDPDLPESVQESPAVACCSAGGTVCSSACMGPFEGGPHYLHYLHHSLSQVNNREETQLHPSTENQIKDLLNMALPIRTRPSFTLNQSLPTGSFYMPLTLLLQRADRMKTTVKGN